MSPVIVVGHKNPDNDAISAAYAYAYLKNELARRAQNAAPDDPADQSSREPEHTYIPCRLGPLPPETQGVFERNNLEAPRLISHVHTRICDVMTRNPYCIARSATLMDAGRMLRRYNVRALIVINDDNTYAGLITTRMIAERYIAATDLLDAHKTQDDVANNLLASLNESVSDVLETDVLILEEDLILSEVVDDIMASSLREAVVLDEAGYVRGIVTRSDIAKPHLRQVILVDHNERRQAAAGIDEASVVEIIDHHRIADITTSNPIKFLNIPVGSSATIVTMEFQREGVEIPRAIAEVLLSAVMTDTVMLKSPTTTPTDHEIARYLADIIGCDALEFGLGVFQFRGDDAQMPIERFVGADAKEFQMGDRIVLIAQHETVNLPACIAREDEIRREMKRLYANGNYEFVLLMLTDIMQEGTQLMCEGNRDLVNRIFGISCSGQGGTWMPGVLSRKKQIAARVLGS